MASVTEVNSQPVSEKNPDHCEYCQGYGFWPFGHLTGIGRMDSSEWGDKCIKCPWCGKGHVDKGERWDILVDFKKKEDEEKTNDT